MNGPEYEQDQLEQQLARAMKRVDPPANFADALMARVAADERPTARVLAMPSRWRTVQIWAAGAVAAAVVAGVGIQHAHHDRERNEATRQFEMASQIEQQALDRTRARLSRSGISLDAQ